MDTDDLDVAELNKRFDWARLCVEFRRMQAEENQAIKRQQYLAFCEAMENFLSLYPAPFGRCPDLGDHLNHDLAEQALPEPAVDAPAQVLAPADQHRQCKISEKIDIIEKGIERMRGLIHKGESELQRYAVANPPPPGSVIGKTKTNLAKLRDMQAELEQRLYHLARQRELNSA